MKRHISSRARIGLRGGERVGVSTVSTTVARFFNGNAHSSSQVKVKVDHHAASLAIAFTMRAGRMYLPRSRASRVVLRTKTGPRARRVREDPSNPHGQATSDAATAGTCAKEREPAFHKPKKASVATRYGGVPLAAGCLTSDLHRVQERALHV
mgnify:CR=1 FL=1